MAFVSLLFPTPSGTVGTAYELAALTIALFAVTRLNWQVLPALSILFVRLVLVDIFHICTSVCLMSCDWRSERVAEALKNGTKSPPKEGKRRVGAPFVFPSGPSFSAQPRYPAPFSLALRANDLVLPYWHTFVARRCGTSGYHLY